MTVPVNAVPTWYKAVAYTGAYENSSTVRMLLHYPYGKQRSELGLAGLTLLGPPLIKDDFAASMAKITVVGTASRDPEFRAFAGQEGLSGDEVRGTWKWSVAVQRFIGKDEEGNWKDETDWFNITTRIKWHADKVRKG